MTTPEDVRQAHFLNQLSNWLGDIIKSKEVDSPLWKMLFAEDYDGRTARNFDQQSNHSQSRRTAQSTELKGGGIKMDEENQKPVFKYKVGAFEADFHRFMEANHPEIGKAIARDKEISAETDEKLKAAIGEFKKTHYRGSAKEAEEEKKDVTGDAGEDVEKGKGKGEGKKGKDKKKG